MKNKILFIIILLCFQMKAKSQSIDTLQWLKTNIEQRSSLFTGNPLRVLFDSLGPLKNSLADYTPPFSGNWQNPDTIFINHITIYFVPGSLEVQGAHHTAFFGNGQLMDTLNTHVPYITVTFTSQAPFLARWLDDDKQKLGSIRWNKHLRNYWGQFIVQSTVVGEY